VIFGNYTTSFYYRTSSGIAVNGFNSLVGKAPHCSVCKHPLRFYEFLPILSAISTKLSFRCNYCGAAIDKIYTALELGVALLFLLNYKVFGINQIFILVSVYSAIAALIAALNFKGQAIPKYIIVFACFLGIIYHTIIDNGFYTWLLQLFLYALFLSFTQRHHAKVKFFESNYLVNFCACCWLNPQSLILFLLVAVISASFPRTQKNLFKPGFFTIYFMVLCAMPGVWL
jgi:hypothetical protein